MKPAYRIIIFIICLALAAGSLVITSFAVVDHAIVNSVMTEPEVFYKIEDNKRKIQLATIYDDDVGYVNNHRYQLYLFYAEGPSNADFYMQQYGDYLVLCCDQQFSYKYDRYDILTGEIFGSQQGICGGPYSPDSYIICNPPNRLYSKGVGSGAAVLWYQILPDGLQYGGLYNGARNDTKLTNEFVEWAVVPPDPVVYRSFTSEPKQDPLNKYVILAGENWSYLYWINIRSRDFEALTYSWDIETDDPNVSDFVNYNEYIKAESFFTPRLTFIANGSSILSLEADQQLLDYYLNQIPSGQSTTLGYIAFDVLITKYDLETGQFIDSVFRSDFRSESWTITIDSSNFFGVASDYDSICVYGLQYLNQSNAILNRASVVWGVDPSFETWKSDISSLASAIYSAVDQMSDDVNSIKSDSDIIVQYLFDMLYDNTEGNNISEIRHNDFVFRSWMYKNFPSGTSSDFYDTYDTDYFSAVYELIRDNLGAEPVEYTTESNAFNNAAEDYSNAEAAVMPNGDDAASELNSALSGAGADSVLGSNGAYGFIRDTINDILFTNTKLTSFVVFALGMGVVVLVLGRKIHV